MKIIINFKNHLTAINPEKFIKTIFSMVRFGNVLGSSGSVVPLFKQQIRDGGPLTVTHPEVIRYFMTIEEAVNLVINTIAISKGGETFILDMGGPIKILDLAKRMIYLSGQKPILNENENLKENERKIFSKITFKNY